MRKTLVKATALVTCLAILLLSAPGTFAAPKATKIDVKRVLKKPIVFIISMFTFLPIFDTGQQVQPQNSKQTVDTGQTFKITGDLMSIRLGSGD